MDAPRPTAPPNPHFLSPAEKKAYRYTFNLKIPNYKC